MAIDGIDCVTFDCYGTLIDWEGGLGSFLYKLALEQGDETPASGGTLRKEWQAIQFDMIQQDYRPYEEVLAESLKQFCADRGYVCSDSDGAALANSMRSWQPFHETIAALSRVLSSGVRLAIISNTDHSIIAHTFKQMPLEFDEIITAEDCGAYKPDRAVFEQAIDRLQVPAERILHVAFGFKYDIGPAHELGWQSAWVNRNDDPTPDFPKPDYVWRDLWALADLASPEGDEED